MSVCRKLPDGTIQKIAGHTILLDANTSEVRQGTWSLTGGPGSISTNITFTDPMPDTDYVVVIEPNSERDWGNPGPGPIGISNKTTTGFTLSSHTFSYVTTFKGTYTAFKMVKIEGYTALQNKVNNPDDTPTIDSMNLVTSDGVARAIENASAVWKGTKAEWNALPATDKVKYDLAVLTDTQLIKSVDRTDGSDSNVADLTGKIFRGTEAEWEALSAAEKGEYEQAETCDVEDPVVVFDPSMPSVKAGAVNHTTTVASNNEVRFNVTFTTAMADSNYAVTLSSALLGTFWADQNLSVTSVTANGFVIIAFNSSSGSYTPDAGSKIYWSATPFIS